MRRIIVIVLSFALVAGCAARAAAQSSDGGWQTTVAPYAMGATIVGTTAIRGEQLDINVAASDVLKNLKWGVMGLVAARKNNWGIGSDFTWASLAATSADPAITVEPTFGLLAVYGLRRLGATTELTYGFRWNVLKNSFLSVNRSGVQSSQRQQWIDPVVGLSLHTSESDARLHASVYGEVGGFGLGSTFAWQIFPRIGVRLTRRFSLDAGYRWMDTDYDTGEGDQRFVWDMMMEGPVIGFVFRF